MLPPPEAPRRAEPPATFVPAAIAGAPPTSADGLRIGEVRLQSARGMIAILLFGASFLGIFYGPVVELIDAVLQRKAPENPPLTRDLLFLSLLYNTVVLLILPLLGLAASRPRRVGAVAQRLRLLVTQRTPWHVGLGAGATLLAMMVLAGVLYGLEKANVYHAEESALVPQIQALLTWQLVVVLPLVAAFTEEIFFRGILQPRVGLIASSLLFGFVHIGYGTVLQLVAPFFLGILFGILFRRTQSLWTAIAAHFTFDFVEFVLLYQDKIHAAA